MSTSNVTETKDSKNEVLITHTFNAPRELVFKAWTEPEQLLRWYAPDGCTIEFKTIDVKEGGTFHSCIHDPVFGDCWVQGTYLEVIYPERLVYTVVLTDEDGNSVSSTEVGKDADLPEETILTVTFAEEGGKTLLTLHQTMPEAIAKQTGAYQSWIKMLKRLDQIVSGN